MVPRILIVGLAALRGSTAQSGYDQYFAVYAHPDVHRQMLQDRPRTEAYGKALTDEPSVVRGKTVLDFGCGTGILSMFAAKAGAERVICVEGSEMAPVAEKVIAANGYSDIIKVVRTSHTKLELPSKVDVIISEWMGFLMVMEDMLDDLLYVRDKWLKPGGVVWPRFAQFWVQPFGDTEWWDQNIGYWDSKPYGFDYSAVGDYAFKKNEQWPWPIRGQWRPEGLVGNPHLVSDWDLQSIHMAQNFKMSSRFKFPMKNETVHGLVIWFDCIFDRPDGNVTMSTHPKVGAQHWGQIFWPLRDAPLKGKFTLDGILKMKRAPPAWHLSMQWRAPPLITKAVDANAGEIHAEHFGVADEWTTTRGLQAFLDAGMAAPNGAKTSATGKGDEL